MLSMIAEAQRQERYFASLAYIDAFQQQFGNDPRVGPMRAEALRQTGQTAASEQAYRALLGTPQAADGWHGLGLIAGARGQYAQAADDFSRAAKLAPTDPRILGDLGYARLRAGDPAGAGCRWARPPNWRRTIPRCWPTWPCCCWWKATRSRRSG